MTEVTWSPTGIVSLCTEKADDKTQKRKSAVDGNYSSKGKPFLKPN